MTTTLHHRESAAIASGHVTFGRVLHAEWIKFWTLRSTAYLLLATVVTMVGLGTLGAWGLTSAMNDGQPVTDAMIHALPSGGLTFGQLLIGALAVLFVSAEYGSGMIQATMITVPARTPVLTAKALIVAAVSYGVGTGSALLTYAAIQPLLRPDDLDFALTTEGVTVSIARTGLYLALVALMALALGALLRNSAGGIVTLSALLLVLPTALSVISGDLAAEIAEYLPSNAGNQLVAIEIADDALTQLQGGLVMGAWALVPLLAATVLLKRRDV
ncbi:ABC transporter permease [Kocuria sp. CPCC 205268]|uniref:ABC transporter permease n=1 Tax=Kocuria oxytropis TaxID=3058913 RepID=UPI0034D3BED3